MRLYNSQHSVPSAWETWATHSRSQTALSYLKVEGLRVKYGAAGSSCCRIAPCGPTQASCMWLRHCQCTPPRSPCLDQARPCLLAVGPGEEDHQAATIIANHPVPLDCPLFYFEITVLSKCAPDPEY